MKTPRRGLPAIRVHALSESGGRVPYLLVRSNEVGVIKLIFEHLRCEKGASAQAVTVSLDQLYQLLCGKGCKIDRSRDSVWLSVGGDTLLITRSIDGQPAVQYDPVSLVELALAWNLFAGPRSD